MYNFLEIQRQQGNLTDEMLDLYLDVFITKDEYNKLKTLKTQ